MTLLHLLLPLFLLTACTKQPKLGNTSVGRDPTWFPLELKEQTPNINAFTNALIMAINKAEKVNLHLVDNNWDDHLKALNDQEVAAILTSLPPLPQNKDRYDFSEPFLLLGPVLIVRNHMDVSSLADLKGKIVSVNQFDDSVLIVQKYPSIRIEQYQNGAQALEVLAGGTIDGLLMPSLEAHALVPHLYPGILKIVTEPLDDKGLRLITLKGKHEALIEVFNKGLNTLEKNGTYSNLRTHFGVY